MKGLKEISDKTYELANERPDQKFELPIYYANNTLYTEKATGREYLTTLKYPFSPDTILEIATNCILDKSGEYSIYRTWEGWHIRKKTGIDRHIYVGSIYKGEYTWYTDFLYAKNFSYSTAVKHVKNLMSKEN